MKKIGIIVFIIALFIGVSFGNLFAWGKSTNSFFSFNVNFGGVRGSGRAVSEKRDAAGFKAIETGGVFEVEVVAQKDFAVEVEADDNLLQFIETEVRGDTLEIRATRRIKPQSPIRVRVAAPNIAAVDLSGASKMTLTNVRNDSLNVEASGASKIKIEGETRELLVDLSGASKFDGEGLRAENANVEGCGASSAAVSVTGDLRADLSGASKLTYAGTPRSLEKSTSGASSVKGK